MRAFTQLRQMLSSHEHLRQKIEEMESKYDEQFQVVFQAIQQLLDKDQQPGKKMVHPAGAYFEIFYRPLTCLLMEGAKGAR